MVALISVVVVVGSVVIVDNQGVLVSTCVPLLYQSGHWTPEVSSILNEKK